MTIEELVDFVQMDLTMSCALPKILPDAEIRRLIVDVAMKWFYVNSQYAVQKAYYYVNRQAMKCDGPGRYTYIQLPCEIQSVTWVFPMNDTSLFNLGISAPNLSINLGVTNQPYLSSYTTTVGELGVYKVVIDYFADVLNMLSKNTLKHDYNMNTNRLNILTGLDSTVNAPYGTSLMLEVYDKIPAEDLYEYEKFRRYVVALSYQQMGRMLTRYDYQLPGGIQVNGQQLLTDGNEERKAVEEEIRKESQVGFFFMVKR